MIGKKLNVCIVDNVGSTYLPAALSLSKFFYKTYYYSVVQNPFPRLSLETPGKGYKEIIVLNEFWNKLDLFDVIIFVDIYFNDWGEALRKMGKLVFGGTPGEELENNRKLFKQELKSAVLPVAPTDYITGVSNLKEYLKDKKDKWVKISYYRGEGETFHHIDWKHSESLLNQMIYTLGPLQNELEFIIEDPIPSVCETGFDGWTMNGQFTDNCVFGFEVKNNCYIGKQTEYKNLPTPVKYVNERFSKILNKYKHNGFYSTEIRCTENGTYYYTDPCMRLGSPPSNTYLEMINNWDEILFGAVNNKLIEPQFNGKYGVELILKSNMVNENYLPITFPKEYKDNIKLKGSFIKDGEYYIIPWKYTGFEMGEIGSVVCVGDNLEQIISDCLNIAKKIEGYDVYYDEGAFVKGMKVVNDAAEMFGFNF